ncbi:uncharacterized protein LOC111384010 [Olea europaea var. sylvestris]|uniref:uncharacterized protein LOC111384010 n=1 Tax=Olea europaea var. sylvestris TaxID=158386 RepID=UPI000C1D0BFC|nr:uncharacterized protein LOC111384010 [Olea europaea var. sylvestris]
MDSLAQSQVNVGISRKIEIWYYFCRGKADRSSKMKSQNGMDPLVQTKNQISRLLTNQQSSQIPLAKYGVNRMANITKLEFAVLDISDKNYLSWVLDADIHLISKGLGETIKEENKKFLQDHAKLLIFLRHHLRDGLKIENLTEKDP